MKWEGRARRGSGGDPGRQAESEHEGRLICGLQPVREAIRAHGARLLRVLVEQGPSPTLEALVRFSTDQGIPVVRVARGELDRIAGGARHQGAAAYAPELAIVSLADLSLGPDALVLALDEIEDPQNFGAIVRSAVALQASCIVWPEHHSAPLSAAMFRASAGAVEHAQLARVPALPSALAELAGRGLTIVGLDAEVDRALAEVDLTGPVALVIGSEGRGLRRPVKKACTRLARLPTSRVLRSLNASVAAGIALYEVGRQRSSKA